VRRQKKTEKILILRQKSPLPKSPLPGGDKKYLSYVPVQYPLHEEKKGEYEKNVEHA
jgi:hypothetical protein